MSKKKKPLHKFLFCLMFILSTIVNISDAQFCSGSWSSSFPLSYDCVSGEYIGSVNPPTEPPGCPINPTYITGQTNTFTFNNPVSSFSIDFNAFSSGPGCARLEVKINGVFYPLTAANISPITTSNGLNCTGENVMTVTNDGYLVSDATSMLQTNGQGKLTITGVNASSVTFSTNDGAGSVFTDPYNCVSVVPLILKSFSGASYMDCKAILNWKTGTELNIKNIEVQRSDNGTVFKKIGELLPKGSNNSYSFETNNLSDGFFRLKINDLDANYKYSEIIKIRSNCNSQNYIVTPNPAKNTIDIKGLKNGDQLLIYDILDRKIMSFNSFQQNNQIDISVLPDGVYYLQIINHGMIRGTLKVIKDK